MDTTSTVSSPNRLRRYYCQLFSSIYTTNDDFNLHDLVLYQRGTKVFLAQEVRYQDNAADQFDVEGHDHGPPAMHFVSLFPSEWGHHNVDHSSSGIDSKSEATPWSISIDTGRYTLLEDGSCWKIIDGSFRRVLGAYNSSCSIVSTEIEFVTVSRYASNVTMNLLECISVHGLRLEEIE